MQSNSDCIDIVQSGDQLASGGPKLSLVAQFDDMCRFANSLITIDEQSMIGLIRKCEENRLGWLSDRRQLIDAKNRVKELEAQLKESDSKLKYVRFQYTKELQENQEVKKQRNSLKNQLTAIKEFVLSEATTSPHIQETRERVLSFMNLNQLETVKEDTNEALDGIEYDVTEENILMDSMPNNHSRRLSKRKSTECETHSERPKYPNRRDDKNLEKDFERMAPKAVFDDNIDLDSPTIDPPRRSFNLAENPNKFSAISKSTAFMSSGQRIYPEPNLGNLSPIFARHLSQTPLEERKHNLHEKKAFKPVYCGPCRQAIGFFGKFLCCEDCRAVCHTGCRAKLPMPCIPFRKPNGKSSQMVLIADFAPQTRPMIPALIIHCCKEIEKRGLQEEGIYRKCGSDREVRELKDKILKSKTGIPVLSHYDIHVLCGVVKQFLRELDEPIVTRILWRDFVRASDQENPDQEKALIMQTVEELPTANRDSLSFIMVHLTRVCETDANQMDYRGLAKIFGPTIVGHSMVDPPMTEILAENPKQIKVMEALFRIPEDYWNGILTSINSWETNRYNNSPDRRMMSSARLGTVQRGTLTPLRCASKGALTLKPLF